jgi:hypothetical protein
MITQLHEDRWRPKTVQSLAQRRSQYREILRLLLWKFSLSNANIHRICSGETGVNHQMQLRHSHKLLSGCQHKAAPWVVKQ